MSLASPVLLIVGLIVAAALGWAAAVLSQRRAASLAAAGVTAAGRARQAGVWLTIAGIAVLAVAAAGPAASVPVPRAAGTVILAMDVSGSMGARDVAPTRLAAAQRAARSFIDAQPDSVDIGVVAFEEGAITTARPSGDHSVAEAAIGRLAVTGGTSLGSAIIASLSAITGKTFSIQGGG
ncbi:MAG TPA: VWA domain-containing protein, partial [Streptosporangiaceae bacterium]